MCGNITYDTMFAAYIFLYTYIFFKIVLSYLLVVYIHIFPVQYTIENPPGYNNLSNLNASYLWHHINKREF